MQEKLDEIICNNLESSTTINEDALTLLFGNPKSGHILGQRRWVTKSSLSVIDMC